MAPLYRRPMKHIDRRELYTSLEARIQYLHSFLDFSTRTPPSPSPPHPLPPLSPPPPSPF